MQFAITVESFVGNTQPPSVNNPSLFAHMANDYLNHPISTFVRTSAGGALNSYTPIQTDLPCDVHLVNLRGLESDDSSAAMILHRRGFVCGLSSPEMSCARNGGKVGSMHEGCTRANVVIG